MIKVLLFAGLQEALKEHELKIEQSTLTVYELMEKLQNTYPQLPSLSNVMVAINEEYVMDKESLVNSGDTVALIPPVSGG
jgi:sulfur-carrier protein